MLHTLTESWVEARWEHSLARTLFLAAGAERLATAALYNLADTMWAEGALEMAIDTMRDALNQARREGNRRFIGNASGNLAGMLTAHGEVDSALAAAREAVPLCREEEYIDWLLPHLALRIAKAGRPKDAAQLWGYADRCGTVWQINEQRAIEALAALLRGVMDPARIEELMAAGRHLSEDQAIALALG
ncbi:MAG: tetratricopeptide repeat protein [Aliidongia sp.]